MSSPLTRRTLPYGMVGKREPHPVVLAEFDFESDSAFASWGRERLDKAETEICAVEGYSLLSLEREGLVFLVGAKKESERAAREALQLVAASFAARIGTARARGATRRFAFNAEFAPAIQRHLEKFSKVGELDEDLAELQSDLEAVKGKAQSGLEKMVERGTALSSLSRHAQNMAGSSERFRASAATLKRHELWQSVKAKVFVGLVVVVLILIVWLMKRA